MRNLYLTTDKMSEWHKEYNKKYFNGELSENIKFEVIATARKNGDYSAGRNRIRISEYWDITEKDARNIMLHEMIHQWQWEKFHDVNHGETFKRKAREINRDGWYIKRCTKYSNKIAEGINPKRARRENPYKTIGLLVWTKGFSYDEDVCFCLCPYIWRDAFYDRAVKRGFKNVRCYDISLCDARAERLSVNQKDLRYYTNPHILERLLQNADESLIYRKAN